MNLNLADIRDKRTNLNAQEIGDDVERSKRWKTFDPNPVFDEDEVVRMVKQGTERLTSMQMADGGWGWSNAGLIADQGDTLLIDTLFDLKLR